MADLSNLIEIFIKEMLEGTETGIIEIQRNKMAEQFDCAPSQINYVLTTRFTPYRGYYIESKRGGGGYIKIVKVGIDKYSEVNSIILETIGGSVTKNKAYNIIDGLIEEGLIEEREGSIIKAAIGDRSLYGIDSDARNRIRADILKDILLILAE